MIEYFEIDNNMDVIEDYMSKIDEQATTLQGKLRELLELIQSNRPLPAAELQNFESD